MQALLHGPLVLLIVQAALIVGLSRLLGVAARAARQPMVIAEIAAGIALGPSLLGWVFPDLSAALFPPSSLRTFGLVSQFGLVLFMFLVGLEFDPSLLRGRERTSIVISQASIALPFALGAGLASLLYSRLSAPDVTFTSFALFMGVSMSITAFPVLARILVERRLLHTRVGAVAIGAAAINDVTAWCVLAFIVAVTRLTGVGGAVVTTLLAAAFIAIMLGVVRPLLARAAGTTRLEGGPSQNLVAIILIFVLGAAWTTELIGIHALFGAFVVGAIIPKAGGFAAALAHKLEDLVVVLLLPMFFALSGLRTEIGLLESAGDWLLCGAIIAVACLGKFGGSTVAALFTGVRPREACALGVLMNTRGLMELIVLNIGLDLGVISPKLFTMMVLMALVTTVMTSPLLEWVYPTSLRTHDVAGEEPPPSPTPASEGFTVLACVAYERSGPSMVNLSAALSASRVYALELVPPADRASFILSQEYADDPALHKHSSVLAPTIERGRELSVGVRPLSFVSAQPAKDICGVAAAKRADLVILGWHRPLLGRAALGGTVYDVLRSASADVGVLIDRGLSHVRRVLVPYLHGSHDRAALALAQRMARHSGAQVTILHVVTAERKLRTEMGPATLTFSEEGPHGRQNVLMKLVEHTTPAEAAVAESRLGYDLVVVGAGTEWGLEHRLFGLQPEYLLERSPTSVLVVRDHTELGKQPAPAGEPRSRPGLASAPT